jgi:hypothetical protein
MKEVASAEELCEAVERIQGCKATFREVDDVFLSGEGGIYWSGPVHVFDVDHPDSGTCYAWTDTVWPSDERLYLTVLGGYLIHRAPEAIEAYLRERKRRAGPRMVWNLIDWWNLESEQRTPAFDIPGDVWAVEWRVGDNATITVHDIRTDNIVDTIHCDPEKDCGTTKLKGSGRYYLIIDTNLPFMVRASSLHLEELPPADNIDWRF